MKKFEVEITLWSGPLTVEIEAPADSSENYLLEQAILKIEEELNYAKLATYRALGN